MKFCIQDLGPDIAFKFSSELLPLIYGLSLYRKYFLAGYDASLQRIYYDGIPLL